MTEFQVSRDAAGKFTSRKARKPAPVTVTRVTPEAMKLAHQIARGRNVHIKLGTGNDAGAVYILNGE